MTKSASIWQPDSSHDILHEFIGGASLRQGAPFSEPQIKLSKSVRAARNGLLKSLFRPSKAKPALIEQADVWAVSMTQNQSESLAPVVESYGPRSHHLVVLDPLAYWGRPLALTALRELRRAAKDLSRLDADTLALVADLPMLLALSRAEARLIIQKAKLAGVSCILFGNDHSPRNRALIATLKNTDIQSVYLQHAAVGGVERPLDMDVAFLQGQHSAEVYQSLGPVEADVRLIGAPKIDVVRRKLKNTNVSPRPLKIGLFPGLFDDVDFVKRAAAEVRVTFPDHLLLLRPHPRDNRQEWNDIEFVALSLSREQDALQTLCECDLVVFDNSNIGLEAAALGIPVVRASFQTHRVDQYKLEATGLFDDCTALPGQVSAIAQRALLKDVRPDEKVLDYLFEGHSTGKMDSDRVAATAIRQLLGR